MCATHVIQPQPRTHWSWDFKGATKEEWATVTDYTMNVLMEDGRLFTNDKPDAMMFAIKVIEGMESLLDKWKDWPDDGFGTGNPVCRKIYKSIKHKLNNPGYLNEQIKRMLAGKEQEGITPGEPDATSNEGSAASKHDKNVEATYPSANEDWNSD